MHENNKRNVMLTETEKTRKRNKKLQQGGCSSDQGVCRNKTKRRMGPEEGERRAVGPKGFGPVLKRVWVKVGLTQLDMGRFSGGINRV